MKINKEANLHRINTVSLACLYETPKPALHYEDEVVRRWWALPRGSLLPLQNGAVYQLLFAGHPGGAAGPDIRDAVFRIVVEHRSAVHNQQLYAASPMSQSLLGDVEVHVRASDWAVHQHNTDPRYNNVLLHAVLFYDTSSPTIRQDGYHIPICSLSDLPYPPQQSLQLNKSAAIVWPCQSIMRQMDKQERTRFLQRAGLLRFEQKVDAFIERLHTFALPAHQHNKHGYTKYDYCLLPALAEGLAYGRDRAFFRAVGLYLVGLDSTLPEPLGRTQQPAPLDAQRLHVLRTLIKQWHRVGAWATLRENFQRTAQQDTQQQLQALRTIFCQAGLSLARSDIIIVNVILPFAAAVALLEQQQLLFQQAQTLYREHPGLSSNRITRLMTTQLCLDREPYGSCQQQGLHYIYQQTCREKRCGDCIAGKNDI
ncbi:MAG: DUF2851 family protein [Chloroflexi bacterium]|nr:MAG: DUF2851 family protein [Chloroflexota bacterium]